jgi:hypothetical protein
MGSSCSHEIITIIKEDPKMYNDKSAVWKFKVADCKCHQCDKDLRMIKKICIDHGIEQPWEAVDIMTCSHDVLMIQNKEKDHKKNMYIGRAECIICKINVPVFATYEVKKIRGEYSDIQTSEWTIDKQKVKEEIKKLKKQTG